jgi:exonuclease SbcC
LRKAQENTLETAKKIAATLTEQKKLVEALARQLEAAARQRDELQSRLTGRQNEQEELSQILAHAAEIEIAYHQWEQARRALQYWEEIAVQFREQEKRRQPSLDEINATRARLLQEGQTLQNQQKTVISNQSAIGGLQAQFELGQQSLAQVEVQLAQRAEWEAQLNLARQQQAEAKAENPRLKSEMDELKERIDRLQTTEGATCPTCGQSLTPDDRAKLIADLSAEGKDLGDRFRANTALLRDAEQGVRSLEGQMLGLTQAEAEARRHTQTIAQLAIQLDTIRQLVVAWESEGAQRLTEISLQLQQENFAPEARLKLAEVDAELKAIGYDAAAHDAARRAEIENRSAEADFRALEKAQATLAPLEREIADLQTQINRLQVEVNRQQKEYTDAAATFAAAQAQAPDLFAAEQALSDSLEQENRLRMDVGAARQKVLVLEDLKARDRALEAERGELALRVGQYKQLERAFGKDGIPALLIEQALPQIETKANEILERLSNGTMSVRFATQSPYKDKSREDLKETLGILISDGVGTRDYEMYSGGEAFRINFAIRLALSEVLAQRAGARLQTLVIDEGFGSQDASGRQRLIEAINAVRQDFAKILVITHIEELKEAFPTRIEVEKSERGSTVRVA